MISDEDKKRLMEHLSACFFATHANRKEAKQIEEQHRLTTHQLYESLTQLERRTKDTALWSLITEAKGVLRNKITIDTFSQHSLKYQGLI